MRIAGVMVSSEPEPLTKRHVEGAAHALGHVVG